MANCSVCNQVMPGDFSDNDGSTHFACYRANAVVITEAPAGPAWVNDPSSGGKIAYALKGTLTGHYLQKGDQKFLWDIASIQKKSGMQVCGAKGNYYHNSDGASRMADKDRSFTSVFYKEPEKNKIVVHGIGNHSGGKGDTSTYTVNWEDGSKTTFTLGKKTDKAAPDGGNNNN